MRPKLVAICGLAGSGKDTAAEALVEDGWARVAFADPIREALLRLDPDIPYRGCVLKLSSIIRQYGWDVAKRDCPPIRRLLQRLGDEVGRQMWGQHFWTAQAQHVIFDFLADGVPVVVTDVRYADEAKWVRDNMGLLVKIRRPGVLQLDHPSEEMDFEPDMVLHNEGTMEELRSAIRRAVQ